MIIIKSMSIKYGSIIHIDNVGSNLIDENKLLT
jgi:hypothetical protein